MNALVRSAATTAVSIALAAAARASGQVHVVDDTPGPGVDFTSLETALLTAQAGDVVLLRSGTYSATAGANPTFFVHAPMTLVADDGAVVVLKSPISVGAVPLGTRVTLRGIRVELVDAGTALSLMGVDGSVWVEDCVLSSLSTGPAVIAPGNGVSATSCASVTFIRSTIVGSSVASSGGQGWHGLSSWSSNISLYDCRVQGGDAGPVTWFPFGGGDALYQMSGLVFASGSTFVGGKGGKGASETPLAACTDGTTGGNGARIFSIGFTPPPQLRTVGCAFVPGSGGDAGDSSAGPTCAKGSDGLPVYVQSGTHKTLPGAVHHLTVSAPVREGGTLAWTHAGPPGEFVFTSSSAFQASTYYEALGGVLVLATYSPFSTQFDGVMPAGGTLTKAYAVNPLYDGVEGWTLYLQSAFFDPATGIFLGAPSATVLLDSAL